MLIEEEVLRTVRIGSSRFPLSSNSHHVHTPWKVGKERASVQPIVMTAASRAELSCLHRALHAELSFVCVVCVVSGFVCALFVFTCFVCVVCGERTVCVLTVFVFTCFVSILVACTGESTA